MKTCFLLLLVLGATPAPAEEPAAPLPGVLLLRNGQMIEGQIVRSDEHYLVTMPDGAVRVREADVELFCHSLEEGYLRKRAAIPWGSVQEHLLLAQWCMRHNLYRFAADELADVAAIEPKHPMLGVLQRRLELATHPQEPTVDPSQVGVQPASPEDLDRMVRGMPPGTVEAFSQIVQPMLMNHCMASGCHGPQSPTKFQLMRTPVTQPAGRRLTQRNLYAVLQYVDCDNAPDSRLLAAIRGPHGPVRAAIFTDRQGGQYKKIVDWVSLVARQSAAQDSPLSVNFGHNSPTAAAPAGEQVPRPLPTAASRARPLPRPGREAAPGAVKAASATEEEQIPLTPAAAARAAARKARLPAVPAKPEAAPKGNATAQGDQPAAVPPAADPFDPEVFNHRYAPAEKQ